MPVENSPVDVACALIEHDGCVLVARRPIDKALGGKWEFPGGKIEPGESGEDALKREIREELAVEIGVGRRLPVVTHDYGNFAIRLHPFVCTIHAGVPHPHEHSEIRWVRPPEIAQLDLAEADRPVLAHYDKPQPSGH